LEATEQPVIELVRNGQVKIWYGFTVWAALTASESCVYEGALSKRLLRRYRRSLFRSALSRDPQKLRVCIRKHSNLIAQPEELLALPDNLLLEGARIITEAI
jgi:hypothetical protein